MDSQHIPKVERLDANPETTTLLQRLLDEAAGLADGAIPAGGAFVVVSLRGRLAYAVERDVEGTPIRQVDVAITPQLGELIAEFASQVAVQRPAQQAVALASLIVNRSDAADFLLMADPLARVVSLTMKAEDGTVIPLAVATLTPEHVH